MVVKNPSHISAPRKTCSEMIKKKKKKGWVLQTAWYTSGCFSLKKNRKNLQCCSPLVLFSGIEKVQALMFLHGPLEDIL